PLLSTPTPASASLTCTACASAGVLAPLNMTAPSPTCQRLHGTPDRARPARDGDGALDEPNARTTLVTATREGSIGETVAVLATAEALERATDPAVRRPPCARADRRRRAAARAARVARRRVGPRLKRERASRGRARGVRRDRRGGAPHCVLGAAMLAHGLPSD